MIKFTISLSSLMINSRYLKVTCEIYTCEDVLELCSAECSIVGQTLVQHSVEMGVPP